MTNKILPYLALTFSLTFLWTAFAIDYDDQQNWTGQCNVGQIQTPIDINTKMLHFCPNIGYYKITLMCQDYPKIVVNNADMTIDTPGGAYIFIFDPIINAYEAYEGYSFHFHTPSEHSVNGNLMDAEMHIKLKPVSIEVLPPEALGEYAGYNFSQSVNKNHFHSVLGFLFQEDENAEFGFFDGMNSEEVNGINVTMINFQNMAGCVTQRFMYNYIGSTTTPPCVEDVRWFVLRDPLPLKPDELQMIRDNKEEQVNNRHVQPLNGRRVNLLG